MKNTQGEQARKSLLERKTGQQWEGEDAGWPEPDTLLFDDPNLIHGFTQVPNPILRDRRLSDNEVRIYALLLSHAWQSKRCFPGRETLAKEAGCSVKTVSKTLAELQSLKLIRIERRGQGKVNVYFIRKLSDAYQQYIDRGAGG